MKSNLDVWAIQNYPAELYSALNNVKGGLNIIYSNVYSVITIGGRRIIGKNFDTFLYNEESDILIMLMKNGKATKQDIINYLEDNNKRYVEVTFDLRRDFKTDDSIPELWFARDLLVLDDAIKDSLKKNVNSCIIYPNAKGVLSLYFDSKGYNKTELDGRFVKSVIKFEDKIVLVTKNIDYISLLKENNMNYEIDNNIPTFNDNNSKKIKSL